MQARMMNGMGQMGGVGAVSIGHLNAGSPARHSPRSAAATPVTNPGGASAFSQQHMAGMGIGHPSAPGQMPPGGQAQGQQSMFPPNGRPPSTTQPPQGGASNQQQPSFGPGAAGRVPTPQGGMMTPQQQHQRNVSMQGMQQAQNQQQQQQQQFNAAQELSQGAPGSQSSAPGNLVPTPSQQAQRVESYAANPATGPGNLNPAALGNHPIPGSAPFIGMSALMGQQQQQPTSNGPSPTGSMGIMSPTNSQHQMRQATPQQQPPMGMNAGMGRGPMPPQQHSGMPPPRPGPQRNQQQAPPQPPAQQQPPTPSTVRGSLPPQDRSAPQQPPRTASAAMVRGGSMAADSVTSAASSTAGATAIAASGTPTGPNRQLMTTAQFK